MFHRRETKHGFPVSVVGQRAAKCLLQRVLQVSYENPRIGLWQQWREDLAAHRGDWTLPGFRAVAVCRFGQWRMQIRSRWIRAPFSIIYRCLFRRCRNVYGIELPDCVRLGRRVVLEHQGDIVIHGNARIGDDCVIRQGVTLGNRHLDHPNDAPVLGHRVQIGAGAKILGKLFVGDDAVIGANAVVLHDVPVGGTVVGVPARLISTHRKRGLQEGTARPLPDDKP